MLRYKLFNKLFNQKVTRVHYLIIPIDIPHEHFCKDIVEKHSEALLYKKQSIHKIATHYSKF